MPFNNYTFYDEISKINPNIFIIYSLFYVFSNC